MNSQWRLFLAALGWVTRSIPATQSDAGATPHQASRFVPVVGACIGFIGAAVYWAGAQIWPTSIAVVLSMLAASLMTTRERPRPGAVYWVFVLFIKYNTLMALSAANVPLPLPAYCALGVIMIVAQAASRGLVVSVMAVDPPAASDAGAVSHITTADLVVALGLGFTPATVLGIPGLIGLVAAIVMRLALTPRALRRFDFAARERLEIVQQLTELGFYLGALASWKYV